MYHRKTEKPSFLFKWGGGENGKVAGIILPEDFSDMVHGITWCKYALMVQRTEALQG